MRLKRIDLRRAVEHRCPGIRAGDRYQYLIKYDGRYYAGSFSEQWYGLFFDNWVNGVGVQFDAPGYNSSPWQAVWQILSR